LATVDGIDPARVATVLGWYVDRIGGPYIPAAYGGESFRAKYPAIAAAYDRAATVHTPPGPVALAIDRRVAPLGWPNGSDRALASAIQTSLDRYNAAMRAANGAAALDPNLARFMDKVYAVNGPPDHYVEHWWTNHVHRRVSGWSDWSGDLGPFIWSPEQPAWLNGLRGLSMEYDGTARYYDQIIGAINANK
jgi:hypothetical protein